MDSDNDADAYDVPGGGAPPGFSLSVSRQQLGNANDDSSADERNSSEDDDLEYGANASRKRRQSKLSGKEENLYGVFYESSDDERFNSGGRNGGNKRSRHFDKSSNRQAGLAFVKGSNGVQRVNEVDITSGGENGSSPNTENAGVPNWLKERTAEANEGPKKTNTAKDKPKDEENDDDDMDMEDDEEVTMTNECEKRFKDLLNEAKNRISGVKSTSRTGVADNTVPRRNEKENDVAPTRTLETGVGGLGFREASRQHAWSSHQRDMESEAGPVGLGLGATSSGIGFQSNQSSQVGLSFSAGIGSTAGLGTSAATPSFTPGGMAGLGFTSPKHKKRNTNSLGKWEKHTKGFGMKMLQRMGYEGSGGLGAKRVRKPISDDKPAGNTESHQGQKHAPVDTTSEAGIGSASNDGIVKKGISRPVEVVVRPNGLGLGFGNFKEQSQLKVNRQIEAEVRGLELPKEEEKKKKHDNLFEGIDKSLLPTTASLLDQGAQSWKRGKPKKARRKIVSYQEILDKTDTDGVKVIDMRGPKGSMLGKSQGGESSGSPAILLGEELLHNVTLLLNTHEGQLRNASYMVKSTERKIANLDSEAHLLNERKETTRSRIDKMKLASAVIDRAEQLIEEISLNKSDLGDDAKLDSAMGSLNAILSDLYGSFSREERRALKFDRTLIPSIVKPLMKSLTNQVNPFKADSGWMDHLAAGSRRVYDASSTEDDAYVLRDLIYIETITPWVSNALASTKWNPANDDGAGVRLFESLLNSAVSSMPGAEPEENEILKQSINNDIVNETVLPRLLQAVREWKPKLDRDRHICNPLHVWVVPWLPFVDGSALLGTILDEVRRVLKKTLSYLSKSIKDDVQFIENCVAVLQFWTGLYDAKVLRDLTSTLITPRFARSLARVNVSIASHDQRWEIIDMLVQIFESGLMANDEFLSLIEGEVLPAWACALFAFIKEGDSDLPAMKTFYLDWKIRMFGRASSTHTQYQQLLRSDSMICRYFYGGLCMIESSTLANNPAMLDDLRPSHPTNSNYKVALMRRVRERKDTASPKDDVIEATTQDRGDHKIATFLEVVESFARQREIEFLPKSGSNAKVDGKSVWLFGGQSVYLDRNAVFALKGNKWQPISLEHLAQACQ